MLTEWTIGNFKSIHEPVTLKLAPFTLFVGANSSGKSTVIQSLLMVAQSFVPSASSSQLVLNGDFVNLGQLEDVLHVGAENQPLRIGFELKDGNSESSLIRFEAVIDGRVPAKSVAKAVDKRYPWIQKTQIEFQAPDNLQTGYGDRHRILSIQCLEQAYLGDLSTLRTLSSEIRERIKAGTFDYVVTQPPSSVLISEGVGEHVKRVEMSSLIPNRLLIEYDVELRQLVDDVKWLIGVLAAMANPENLSLGKLRSGYLSPYIADVFELVRFARRSSPARIYPEEKRSRETYDPDLSTFQQWVIRNAARLSQSSIVDNLGKGGYEPRAIADFGRRVASAFSEYERRIKKSSHYDSNGEKGYEVRLFSPDYSWALGQIRQAMGQLVYYLGPLRSAPSVVYAAPPYAGGLHLGLQGEFTAAMLDEYRNIEIEFPLPLDDFHGKCQLKRAKLIDALIIWLNRMGLVESVDTEETPKVGYRLSVYSPGLRKRLDLTSVGVGVSQVLPTLVLCLLAPENSILVFEQPELHLHPKVQSVLADFFLGISMCRKQCIVETHSEHIINRLRRRIADSPAREVLEQSQIYFVEKENSVSHFRLVEPNEYGSILAWPNGFFDEAELESSALLHAQMRKMRTNDEFASRQQNRSGK